MNFKNVIDSINKINDPYIRRGKTRAVNANNADGIILTDEEKEILKQNEQAMLDASYKMFETIGLTKQEIELEIGEENSDAVIIAGLLAMSATHDNDLATGSTRAITGNTYVDCALSAIGLDLATGIRTAFEKGISKNVAKTLIKSALKATLGTTAGVAITVGIWGLCVAGIG